MPLNADDLGWLTVSLLTHQSATLMHQLMQRFATPEEALATDWPEASDAVRTHRRAWQRGMGSSALRHQVEQAAAWLNHPQHRLLCRPPLRAWHDLPDPHWAAPLLWVSGNPSCLDEPQIALVGSRAATPYGLSVAGRLAQELAVAGFTISSGLASGIDGAAHRAALSVEGSVVGVLGCGIDQIYPPSHRRLHAQVAEAGALVSEFAPGTSPQRHFFPRRNHVMASLALGVVVVEAGAHSGSLITARAADSFSRSVWAVPGPIHSVASAGSHDLLREGLARLVRDATDILVDCAPLCRRWYDRETPSTGSSWVASEPSSNLSPAAQQVLAALGSTAQSFDALQAQCPESPVSQLLVVLGELELTGWVMQHQGLYQRRLPQFGYT